MNRPGITTPTTEKRYTLARYPGNPCHTTSTAAELRVLGMTSNYLQTILVYAKLLATMTEWSVRVYDTRNERYTYIVTCLGHVLQE